MVLEFNIYGIAVSVILYWKVILMYIKQQPVGYMALCHAPTGCFLYDVLLVSLS